MRFVSLFPTGLLFGAFLVSSLSSGNGAVVFQFNYSASPTDEFNDPTDGTARRNALASAASMIGGWFDHTATVVMDVTGYSTNNTTLASAGSQLSVTGGFLGYISGVVGTKILTNGASDLNGATADGEVNVNFFHSWDLDDDVGAGSYDFKSTLIHELLHAVGFASLINEDGSDVWGHTANEDTDGGIWATFDDFVEDADGNAIIDDTDFTIDLTNWNADSVGGTSPTNGLFFDGPNARAANGGQPVGLYTPTTWNEGSSVSHLDTDNKSLEDLLMTHSTSTGPGPRTLSAVEEGVLMDLGFSLIPEPSSTSLLVFAAMLVATHRRRKTPHIG